MAGGFPCQPFSTYGRRRGIADERWGWPWMRDVIDAIRPRYVLAENVAALLRDTDAFRIILDDLSHLGYLVEWSVVPACSLGAPHTTATVRTGPPRGQRWPTPTAPTGPTTARTPPLWSSGWPNAGRAVAT
ncbi:DNA cytosine methyltransferase [Saccharopolyspora spinosporotrichia]